MEETEDNFWKQVAEREIARPIACDILSTCACTREEGFLGIAYELGHETDSVACELAEMAWDECAWHLKEPPGLLMRNPDLYYKVCAEAESLLQRGWFPGEPVEMY